MVNFLDTQSDARRFAALLADYDRRLQALERSTQAAHTSIEGGAMDIYDADGNLKGSVGVQPDGGVALVPVNTAPPPTPVPPTVESVLAGLVIGWDGTWDDAYATPTDFALVQVHVGPTADFTPDATTVRATITNVDGGTATIAIEGYDQVWVRLVAANTAAITGPPSAAVAGQPRQAVGQDLVDGTVTDVKLAERAVTEAKIALGAVGAAALADGAVLEAKLAKAAVTLDKIAQGAVTINALGGALSDSAAQRYVDAMGDPTAWTSTAKGTGAAWNHLTGVADAPTGQTVGQAQGFVRLLGSTLVPYEPGTLYRVSARVRLTGPAGGADSFYVGVAGIGADKKTLVNRVGAYDSPNSHYYVAASGKPITTADGWVTVVGYLKDRAAPGASGSAGPNNDPRSAGLVHADVRYICPYLWLNYSSQGTANAATVMQVDAVTIEALKTGLVDATNLVAGSVTTAALATDSVTAGKVAADAIGTRELQANSVTAVELAAGSVTANAVAAGAITTDKLTVSGGANILPDPSFEGAVTASLIVGLAYATQDRTKGNGSPASLKVNCLSATAVNRDVPLTLIPALAGDQLHLAVDYFASSDWAGASVNIHARWEDNAGTVLGYGVVGTTGTPALGAWTRLSGTVTAPAGTVRAAIRVQAAQATAGDAWFDNAAVRPVIPGVQIADGAITAPKILAGAVTAEKIAALSVTAEKIASLAVTTDKLSALSVTADKLAVNSVTATKISAGAVDATHIKAGAVQANHLAVGSNGNLIPDPSFETGYIAGKLSAVPGAEIITGGNNSGKALKFHLTETETRSLLYDAFPVTAGERYWAAYDFKGSTDFVGSGGILMALQWLDNAGAHIDFSVISNSGPQPDNTWRREKYIHTAPAGAAYCRPRLQSPTGTGAVYFDNVELRPVLSSAAGDTRVEISPDGLRMFDAQGEETVSLVTGRPNYLTLTTDGQPVATIDQNGNAGFGDLAVAGSLTIGGDPIEEHLTLGARGLIAVDYQATAVTAGSTDYGFVELAFDADTSRMYRVVLNCYADPSVAGGELVLTLKDGGASTPTISSTQIQSAIYPMPTAGYQRVHMETIRSGASFGAGLHRLLTTFRVQNGPSGQTVRLFGGTNHPGVMYVEDVGPYIPETGQYNTGGGTTTPPVKQYTKTYAASWSGSYANRGSYNSYYGNSCYQGYYSSTNGMQAALIGFPASLSTDLAGATINKVQIYLYFDHWYYNSGGKAVIKAHKHASRPSTFSCDTEAMTVSWGKNVGQWVDITAVFDSTSWRGIALDPNNSDKTYYGRARGYGQTYAPQLRVTYTK
ncbi:hypothetical protein [Streptomyces sp. PBH53]|uniref:hypothetical protein n=1 Tax=Streptomyces sp. PBH53 TaxID=1577075 RepID=UPI000A7796B2|nr:hypothetical protein [Streptomyces sp. PBH53]